MITTSNIYTLYTTTVMKILLCKVHYMYMYVHAVDNIKKPEQVIVSVLACLHIARSPIVSASFDNNS